MRLSGAVGRWVERLTAVLRVQVWRLLLLGIRNSGAAFIKWGQWSATREDLFPQVGPSRGWGLRFWDMGPSRDMLCCAGSIVHA